MLFYLYWIEYGLKLVLLMWKEDLCNSPDDEREGFVSGRGAWC